MIASRIKPRALVRIKPTQKASRKYGRVSHESDSEPGLWWVLYLDEYGGKYWYESDLELAPDKDDR